MNLLNAQSPEDEKGSAVVRPKSPGPCSLASCSWKTVRTADPHASPAGAPQGHFCRPRHKMMVGYKTNLLHTSPPFPQPLLSCPLPKDVCYLCQNGLKEKPTLAMPAGAKGQGWLRWLTKTLKSGHSLFLAFSFTDPQRIYLTTHGTTCETGGLNFELCC